MTTPLPVASRRAALHGVLLLVTGRPLRTVLGGGLLTAAAAARVGALLLLGRLVDVTSRDDVRATAALVAAVAVTTLAAVPLSRAGNRVLGAALLEQAARLREDALRAALGHPATVVEAAGSGDLLSRLSEDAAAVTAAAARAVPAALGALLTTVVTLAGVAVLDPRLAAAMLVAVPVQAVALHRFLRRSGPVYRELATARGARSQHLLEAFTGVRSLVALGQQQARLDGFAAASRRVVDRERAATRVRTGFFGTLNGAELVGLAAVLAVGAGLAGAGQVTAGAVAAAALCFHALFGPIGVLLSSVDEVQLAAVGVARLVGVAQGSVRRPPGTDPPGADSPPDAATRSGAGTAPPVRVTGLRYAYPVAAEHDGPPLEVLHGIDLDLPAGSVTAVVGSSGAGKSTLARLVTGQLVPTAGQVRRSAGLRVAAVSQESHVFRGTLRDDLRLATVAAGDGRAASDPTAGPGASTADERLATALDALGAHWVDRLPAGLDTAVGAGGHALTPAQVQHLALVRVLLRDPDLLVLDEATSEAGSADTRVLDDAVRRLVAGRTALLVAHRLDQCLLADRVVVLEDGLVVEQGTHEALLDRGGRYAGLWAASVGRP